MSDESENPNENPEELAHRDSITSARLSNQSSSVPLTSITGSGESLRSNNAAPAQEASRRSSNNTRNQSQADGGPEDGRSRQSSNASASLSDSQREQSGSLGQSSAVDFRERGSIPTEAFGEHGSQAALLSLDSFSRLAAIQQKPEVQNAKAYLLKASTKSNITL